MNLQVGVKALIKNSENQFLFLRRTEAVSTDAGEPSWDIPGGRINPEEELLEALKREIVEEIGHSISTTPKLIAAQDIFVQSKDLHVVRLTYLIEENVSEIGLSDEHDKYEWVNEDNLASVKSEPYLAEILSSI